VAPFALRVTRFRVRRPRFARRPKVPLLSHSPSPSVAASVALRRSQWTRGRWPRQVRALEPRVRIGQIITVAVGDVARAQADFLSLNSARATAEVIRRAHSQDKAVHVWTVNRPEVMLRMIEQGADNLITNYPEIAVRVLQQCRSLSATEQLALRLRVLFSDPPPELIDPQAVTTL
jgi:Glycerophosphoryl diester phosphodiesterase family